MSDKLSSAEFAPSSEPLGLGDVIQCEAYAAAYDHVILDVQPNGCKHAIAIVDEENHRYGLPGTIPAHYELEVVGHRSHQQVVEMIARMLGNGALTDENLAIAQRHYPEPS